MQHIVHQITEFVQLNFIEQEMVLLQRLSDHPKVRLYKTDTYLALCAEVGGRIKNNMLHDEEPGNILEKRLEIVRITIFEVE